MSPDVIAFLVVVVLIALGIGFATRRASRLPPKKAEALPEAKKALPEKKAAEPEPEEEPEEEEEEEKEDAPEAGRDNEYVGGLAKTRGGFVARLGALFGKKQIDEALFDQLEEVLYTADIGVKTSAKLFEALKKDLGRADLQDPEKIWPHLKEIARKLLDTGAKPLEMSRAKPFVVLVIGVNGAGKTTSIGKLAARFTAEGKKVLLAAGDTFRAAAVQQLEIWGQRASAPVVRGPEEADPASVIFEAIQKAKSEKADVCICDTAGRLHTKVNLMEELKKLRRVMNKAHEGAPHEVILVLDATTGQNAITQARQFKEAVEVSSLALTKLDGTAKGGVVVAICDELGLPVRYIGVGEKVEDLRDFDAGEFVEALFEEEPVRA